MNEIFTDLFKIIDETKASLQSLPVLRNVAQWSALIERPRNNISARWLCEYVSRLFVSTNASDENKLLGLVTLETCMERSSLALHEVKQWCRMHPARYAEWYAFWIDHRRITTYGFDERFLKIQKDGSERIASAWAWNVPYLKRLPVSSSTLFPPSLLFTHDAPSASTAPYVWTDLIECDTIHVHVSTAQPWFLNFDRYRTGKDKPEETVQIPTYVFTLWHEFPQKTKTPWDDPLPRLLCACEHEKSGNNGDPAFARELDFVSELSAWFSTTLRTMINENPATLSYTGKEQIPIQIQQIQGFCRSHFNTSRVNVKTATGTGTDNMKMKQQPWILDGGFWFRHATEAIVRWSTSRNHNTKNEHKQKKKEKENVKRSSLNDAWLSETTDSEHVAFTTALFGIRAREANANQNNGCKTVDAYFGLAKKLFDWKVNLYVYIEPAYVDAVYEQRHSRGLAHRTFVIPTYMEQSRFWPSVTRITERYASNAVPRGFCKHKDTGLYVFSQATKYDCLSRSIHMDVFKSRSHYWIDFGIHHVVLPPPAPHSYEMLLQQLARNQRLHVTYLRGLQVSEIANKQVFYSRLQQAVAGGLIGGPTNEVSWLVEQFEREFTEALQWYPVLDEAILASIALTHPDKFIPIWSGHIEMFQLRSSHNALRLIREAIDKKNWQRAYDIALELEPEHVQKNKALLKDVCTKLHKTTGDAFYKQELVS